MDSTPKNSTPKDSTPKVLDFKINAKTSEIPRYRFLRISLNNIQGDVPLSLASQLCEFKIPAVALNYYRSILQYSEELPNDNGKYNWVPEDVPLSEFNSVQLGTASGLNLVDLNHLQNYMKYKLKMKTSHEEFISRDPLNCYYPASMIGLTDKSATQRLLWNRVNDPLDPNIGIVVDAPAGADIDQIEVKIPEIGNTNEKNILLAPYTVAADNNYNAPAQANGYNSPFRNTDPKYTYRSDLGAGGADGILVRNRQIMLSDIKDTLFSEDKDFYSPVELYLRLQTALVSRVGVKNTDANQPGAGAPEAVTASLKNVYLYLAVQQNQVLIDELKHSVVSGEHKFRIPFTTGWRNSINAGAGQVGNFGVNVTSQYGSKLHSISFTVAANDEQKNNCLDASNWNGSKIRSYQTYLDSRPLTDYIISCAQPTDKAASSSAGGDWRENKKFVENKMMNYGQYQMNWFHCDAFFDPKTGDEGIDLTNSDSGLDIQAVRSYNVELTSGGAHTVYTYATFLRDVMITPTGDFMFG